MCLLLPSSFFLVLFAQNEPTTQKQRADRGFFIWLKDYIIWFSMCCVHILAHTNLVADGRKQHTCAHHTLTVSFLLTQTHFESVQTGYAHTSVHRRTLSGDTTPTFVCKLDPQCPRHWREDIERDQWTDVCVHVCLYSQLPLLPPSPFIFLFPNSKLQIQQSVTYIHSLVKSHTSILSIFICFIHHLTECAAMHMTVTCNVKGTNFFLPFFPLWARN